ncbi:D-alanyl-D-alanine carboxypeptidase family protein [Salinithrix halophila]|uniref:serine-type D-Ala-D-Ala carboxypeptidase n=1 Tax=Salinithrix halophila TaxID=1485204 RepID=A0ABV8JE56_9BACL
MFGKVKKSVILCCCFCLFFGWFVPTEMAEAASTVPVKVEARSYILLEMDSGLVLAEHHSGKPYAPASMTKIMTEYLILERIKQNKVSWKEKVRVSKNAARIGEAQVFLKTGEERTIRELFTAMAVYSANDAAVALTEHIAGSETAFVDLMNRKAAELGLIHTHFTNCTGLPRRSYPDYPDVKGKHQMSAEDIAQLTRRILTDYPEVIETVSLSHYTFRSGEKDERKLINWNRMLPGLSRAYRGLDGFKTGYTREAGYGFSGSAKRHGMRLVSVVMGTNSKVKRFTETQKLLDYGFDHYERKKMIESRVPIPGHRKVPVKHGAETEVPVVAERSLTLPIIRADAGKYRYKVEFPSDLKAPLKAGTVVGKAKILYDGEEIPGLKPVRLIVQKDVDKAGWLTSLFRSVTGWF